MGSHFTKSKKGSRKYGKQILCFREQPIAKEDLIGEKIAKGSSHQEKPSRRTFLEWYKDNKFTILSIITALLVILLSTE